MDSKLIKTSKTKQNLTKEKKLEFIEAITQVCAISCQIEGD